MKSRNVNIPKEVRSVVKSPGASGRHPVTQSEDRGSPARSDSSADRGSDRRPVEIQGAPKRRAYRAGSFKVPVDDPAMLLGDQGELGRRFKKHLRGVVSRTAISDPDESVSAARPAASQTRRRPLILGMPKIFNPGHSVSSSSDDGGDDEGEG